MDIFQSEEYKVYVDSVCSIIWADYHGYTFNFDNIEDKLKFPYLNKIPAEKVAKLYLDNHAEIVELVEAMVKGDEEAKLKLKLMCNDTNVIALN